MAIYIDDRELVAAHRAGDNGAFDELVREHRDSLLAHAKRKLNCDASAEDALQETLVRAYKALPKFDGEYRLGPWMHRIMHNVCIDEAVRRRRDGEKTNNFAAQPIARNDAPSVEDELGMHFDGTDLNSALDDLSASHREALVLRFVDELNYDEVAQMSGVSEQNARARVSRARSAMRVAMKGVAALPVILFGLLRRGEKAAAAVTSTTGAATVSAHSVTAPALAEATVAVAQAAPVAVPVIAKAAVGIGLIAAVFTPTTDSAVHQAVENLATSNAGVTIEETVTGDALTIVSDGDIDTTHDSNTALASDAYSPIETVSPSVEQPLNPLSGDSSKIAAAELIVAGAAEGKGAFAKMEPLEFTLIGGGRYTFSGPLQLSIESTLVEGSLSEGTWLRLDDEIDNDGRRRLDGLFDFRLLEGDSLIIRVAGFAEGELDELRIAGLFRTDQNSLGVAEAGSFHGSIAIDMSPGLIALTFIP